MGDVHRVSEMNIYGTYMNVDERCWSDGDGNGERTC